jgi:hypothetical protein
VNWIQEIRMTPADHVDPMLSTRSDSIGALVAALAKAQGAMKGATKDALNPHFKSKYADLASVWEACRAPLASNGLAILQPVSAIGPSVTVTTLLAHSSGEWIAESLTMTATANTPQAVGSAITYGRRYGLSAMVGIAPEDDDGEAASTGRLALHDSSRPGAPQRPAEVFIERIDSTATRNPKVKRYLITDSNGETASTINTPLINTCERYRDSRTPVLLKCHDSSFGRELDAVIPAAVPEPVSDLTADEIPF